jgi:hypothetical protein
MGLLSWAKVSVVMSHFLGTVKKRRRKVWLIGVCICTMAGRRFPTALPDGVSKKTAASSRGEKAAVF